MRIYFYSSYWNVYTYIVKIFCYFTRLNIRIVRVFIVIIHFAENY